MHSDLKISLFLIPWLFGLLIILFSACDRNGGDHRTTYMDYKAVNGADTAVFRVSVTDKQFKGMMEINYHGAYKDSGEVSGYFKGDTLWGNFLFIHYDIPEKHRIPIALLQKKDQLLMGTGTMEIFLQRTFFKKGIPIDYEHPKFVFKKVN